jgi:hypothetical protein
MEGCEKQNSRFGQAHVRRNQDDKRVNTGDVWSFVNGETLQDIQNDASQQRLATFICTSSEYIGEKNPGGPS